MSPRCCFCGRRKDTGCAGWIGGFLDICPDCQARLHVTPRRGNTDWIPVGHDLPKERETVVLLTEHGPVLGCRYEDEDGWYWCCEYDAPYWAAGVWRGMTSEPNPDIEPTHWARLPEPPKGDGVAWPTVTFSYAIGDRVRVRFGIHDGEGYPATVDGLMLRDGDRRYHVAYDDGLSRRAWVDGYALEPESVERSAT